MVVKGLIHWIWLICLFITPVAKAEQFDHSHAKWNAVVKTFTTNGLVYYSELKEHPARLKSYLQDCSKVTTNDFRAWSTNEQKAFLINVYNASLTDLIIDRYPIETVRQIGGFYKGPFKQDSVYLFGEKRNLEYVERILRTNYNDVRTYFSLSSGAKSGPDLLSEAYNASILEDQIAGQTRRFLADEKKNVFDAAKAKGEISILFKTIKTDLSKERPVLKEIADYLPEDFREIGKSDRYTYTYMDFDWGLNEATGKFSVLSK